MRLKEVHRDDHELAMTYLCALKAIVAKQSFRFCYKEM